MRKLKIGTALLILIVFIGGMYFCFFSPLGRMMTIQYRGFEEIDQKIYINKEYMYFKENILEIISQAKERDREFWGELENDATIIVCDDNNELKGLGNPSSAITTTGVLNGKVFSYIVITPRYLTVDVVAHELTHAELQHRLIKGKFIALSIGVPVWFNEGLALQNDYRERYSENTWKTVTQNGQNITDFSALETTKEFYNSDKEVTKYNYIISKHEVEAWLNKNGKDKLTDTIKGVHEGKIFNELYNE